MKPINTFGPTAEAFDLVRMHSLMASTRGNPTVAVGLIDGPVDTSHPSFHLSRIRSTPKGQTLGCKVKNSTACVHGTFVAGMLCAERGGFAPGICPDCEIILRPVFAEVSANNITFPTTTPEDLAIAIIETVKAGAKIINMSLGVLGSSVTVHCKIVEACDYARRQGTILIAASGNQGTMGYVPLLHHPWIIPVAACDNYARLNSESNIGPSIGRRGVMAPGKNITSTAPGGKFMHLSGTSVAAPFVTGAIALLWSEFPDATAEEVKNSIIVANGNRRRSVAPPVMDVEAARGVLETIYLGSLNKRRKVSMENETNLENSTQQIQKEVVTHVNAPGQGEAGFKSKPPLIAAQNATERGSCPTCNAGNSMESETLSFVYALGTIECRFPSLAIEKEFSQAISNGDTANLTDPEVFYNVIKQNRYLANEVCWLFSVENIETYILMPKEPIMIDQLIEAIKPGIRGTDVDVVIGTKGPLAPVEMCNGLQVPMVSLDQIYSFDRPALIKAIPKPKQFKEEEFRNAAEELFARIQQVADNVGAMDEHRALNYLAVRHPRIYDLCAEKHSEEFSLTKIGVITSRLTGARKLLDVVLSFTNRKTDVVEKYYVRVDVTERYPFLVSKLAPYYDRL